MGSSSLVQELSASSPNKVYNIVFFMTQITFVNYIVNYLDIVVP